MGTGSHSLTCCCRRGAVAAGTIVAREYTAPERGTVHSLVCLPSGGPFLAWALQEDGLEAARLWLQEAQTLLLTYPAWPSLPKRSKGKLGLLSVDLLRRQVADRFSRQSACRACDASYRSVHVGACIGLPRPSVSSPPRETRFLFSRK
jgi:hypothetical protein